MGLYCLLKTGAYHGKWCCTYGGTPEEAERVDSVYKVSDGDARYVVGGKAPKKKVMWRILLTPLQERCRMCRLTANWSMT